MGYAPQMQPPVPDFEPPLTPALVIDLDAVDHNVAAVLARAGGPGRWRPHVKTVKSQAVIARLLAAGVHCLKVATVPELELVLEAAESHGSSIDVLVAYPLRGSAVEAVEALARRHAGARIHLLADDPAHLTELRATGLPIFLDVDLGMGRTGTPPEDWRGVSTDGVSGLHGYDGHHTWTQRQAAHAGYDRLCALADALGVSGLDVITSGTHSYAHALDHEGLQTGPWRAQISPGTVVLSDTRTAPAAADLGLRQAAWVVSRAVSVRGDRVTLDAGSKALSPDARPSGVAPAHPDWAWRGPSEEHQPCRGEGVCAGSLVWLVPTHVCTTVNLYREAWFSRSGAIVTRQHIGAAGRALVV